MADSGQVGPWVGTDWANREFHVRSEARFLQQSFDLALASVRKSAICDGSFITRSTLSIGCGSWIAATICSGHGSDTAQ